MRKGITMVLVAMAVLMLSVFSTGGALARDRGVLALQAQDPLAVLQAFVDAVNAEDPDAAAALFTEDAFVDDNGNLYEGQTEISDWLASFSPSLRLEILDTPEPEVTEDSVRALVRVTADELQELGLTHVDFIFDVTVQDGLITSLSTSLSPEEERRIERAIEEASGGGESSGGGMPRGGGDESPSGMPRSGNGSQNVLIPMLTMLGLAAIGAGYTLSRRKAQRR